MNRTLIRKGLNSKSFNSLQLIFSEVVGGGTTIEGNILKAPAKL